MAFATSPASALNPWLQILAALEKKVIRQSFETWLKPTRYSHAAGRTLYVRVPSPEFQHIGDKYGDLIQEAIDLQSLEFDDVSFRDRGRRSFHSAAAQGWRIRPGCRRTRPRLRLRRQPARPEQSALRLVDGRAAQFALHVRQFRYRQWQPIRARGFARGRRASLARIQSAVPVWRRRNGQDAPDARHRPRSKTPPAARRISAMSRQRNSPTR